MNKKKLINLFQAGEFSKISSYATKLDLKKFVDLEVLKICGYTFFRLNNYEQAIRFLKLYLLNKFDNEINYYLSQSYFLLNEYNLCLEQIEKFSQKDKSSHIPIVSLRANAYLKNNQVKDALITIENLHKEIEITDPRLLFQSGYIAASNREFDKAISYYLKSLSFDTENQLTKYNLGIAYAQNKNMSEALGLLDQIKSVDLKYLADLKKGAIYHEIEEYDNAIRYYKSALEQSYNQETLFNLALVQIDMDDYEGAVKTLDSCIKNNKENLDAYFEKARVLKATKRITDYEALIKIIQQKKPNYKHLNENKWTTKLNNGDIKSAFITFRQFLPKTYQEKELRLELIESTEVVDVVSDQGLGDQIFNIRFLKLLSKQNKKITFYVDTRLTSVVKSNLPNINVKTLGQFNLSSQNRPFVMLSSLMFYFLETIKYQETYFKIDPIYRSDINLNSKKMYCGISWKSFNERLGNAKSVSIVDIENHINLKKFSVINLQYKKDENLFKKNNKIEFCDEPYIDITNDLEGLFYTVSRCNFILTVSNSLAHVAGSLGIKTVLIIPKKEYKLWYWNQQTSDTKSALYPSIKIFEREDNEELEDLFKKIDLYINTNF